MGSILSTNVCCLKCLKMIFPEERLKGIFIVSLLQYTILNDSRFLEGFYCMKGKENSTELDIGSLTRHSIKNSRSSVADINT